MSTFLHISLYMYVNDIVIHVCSFYYEYILYVMPFYISISSYDILQCTYLYVPIKSLFLNVFSD